jgi:hypothetical protein
MSKWKELINLRVKQNYTCMQSITHSYINGNPFWSNEGLSCFAGIEADYNQLNPDYFRWIDKRFDYALSKGIVPVMLFTWMQDYGEFSNAQFNRYVKYLVSRYSAMNVIWIICGEYDEIIADYPGRTTEEFIQWGILVKQKDPYNHPVSLHPTGRSSSREFGNESWMDFIGQQSPYGGTDITRDLEFGKPAVNLELRYMYPFDYGAGENSQTYEQLFSIVKAGGYYTNGFYTVYAPDKGGLDFGALPEEQNYVSMLNKMVKENRVPATWQEVLFESQQVGDEIMPDRVRGLRIVK